MKTLPVLLSAAALGLAAASGARAGVTFTSAEVSSSAAAYAMDDAVNASDFSGDTAQKEIFAFPSAPVVADISKTATAKVGDSVKATATETQTSSLTLASAYSGVFSNDGSSSVVGYTDTSAAYTSPYGDGNFGMEYDFAVTSYSTIHLTGTNSCTNGAGCAGTFFQVDGDTIVSGSRYISNSTDNFDFGLVPGNYRLEIYSGNFLGFNDSNLYISGIATRSATHTNTLSFNISAAPEPSTWALMMAGVGLAGAALRRRRVGGALAA